MRASNLHFKFVLAILTNHGALLEDERHAIVVGARAGRFSAVQSALDMVPESPNMFDCPFKGLQTP